MTKNWKYVLMIAGAFTFTSASAQTLQDGKRAIDRERYAEAKKSLNKLLSTQNDEATNIALGDAYLKSGVIDSAAHFYSQAAAKDAKSAIGMVAAGKAALLRGNAVEAEAKFNEAVKRTKSKDANVLTMIGGAYYDTNNFDKAVDYLKRAVGVNYKNAEAQTILGDAYLRQGKGGDAMSSYERAIEANNNYTLAHFKKGMLSVSSRNFNAAQEAYKTVLAQDPNFAPAYREIGELYLRTGKNDLALENFKKFNAMAENTAATKVAYASSLYNTKDYKGTIKEAQDVLKKDPNNLLMNRLIAYSYYETGDNEKALAAMENYFKIAPKERIITRDYEYYGKMLSKANRNDEALTTLNRALELDSTQADLRNEIAQIYVKQNNFPKAIALYRAKMRSGKPTNTDYYYLGSLYDQAKNYQKADSMYSIITTANPTYAQAHIWRARANANLDPETKKGLARPHYEQFIILASADKEKNKDGLVEANSYLGYYYYTKGDKAKATQHWTEVRALEPGNKQAKAYFDSLNPKKAPAKKK